MDIEPPKFKKYFHYGTAGFRYKYSPELEFAVFCSGVVSFLLSKKNSGKSVGVMITASHNPKQDNGVKLVSCGGGMIKRKWEEVCERLVNCGTKEKFNEILKLIIRDEKIDEKGKSSVVIGFDSRESSEKLFEIFKKSSKVIENSTFTSVGLCSTPVVHYLVYSNNRYGSEIKNTVYYENLSKNFNKLMKNRKKVKCVVDTACAVGSKVLEDVQPMVKDSIEFTIFNKRENVEWLNDKCGSEHVQSKKQLPRNYKEEYKNVCCFDGDSDRLIFFFMEGEKLTVIEGDKISALIAKFVSGLLETMEYEKKFSVGVVQTAYSNGRSTSFLKSTLASEENVSYAKTGVKYLHPKALKYDVGIYFESNGHGTILFSEKIRETLKNEKFNEKKKEEAREILLTFSNLINPVVGDAVSDLLGVMFVLDYFGITFKEWNDFYHDLPTYLTKTTVEDRTKIITNDDETKVLKPEGMQKEFDELIKSFNDKEARSTVRPSGTEDIVRVYVECSKSEKCVEIANGIIKIIKKYL